MENVSAGTRGDVLKASKVRSQTHLSDPNTMESFQDGGQQNMNSEHNEYPSPMEGSHMNPDMNNFSPGPGEGSMGPDGMHSMPNYSGYGRSSYGMSDQHGGMMSGNVEYSSQNSQYSGQFSQNSVRPSYTGMPKPGMPAVRPGMMPPGMGMIPGTYNSNQRMMSGQGITQQSGPTPTLNQLLQSQNTGQRFSNNYGDFSSGQGKSNDLGGPTYPGMGSQQGWNGSPRSLGPYTQGPMQGTPYRNQGGTIPENRRPSGMAPGPGPGGGPGYPHQSQYMSPAMAANAQRYMMGQVRPSHLPMSGHSYSPQVQGSQYAPSHSQMNYSPSMPNQSSQPPSQQQQQQHQQMYHGQQQQPQPPGQPPPQTSPTPGQQQQSSSHRPPSSHSQGPSPRQASPAPSGIADQNSNHSTSSKKSEDNPESHMDSSNVEEANGENSRGTPNSGTSQSHVGVSSSRPSSSPVGSSGSRSNTPAPIPGTQSGSPMPPRPPSSHLEGQNRLSHSPMATQGFNQPMMPPPMPGQMGYGPGSGGKMAASTMSSGQMPPHYSPYNSQYPQGNYGRQQNMPGMPAGGPGPGMQGNYPQSMYNGPGSQMGPGPNMYNNMMSRGMQSYGGPYGPGNLGMNSQYGAFNSHMGPAPGQGPGPGPAPGPGPGQAGMGGGAGPMPIPPGAMIGGQAGMGSMGQPGMGMPQVGPPTNAVIPGKGAQAAAQAALMAAASSAGSRPLTPNRGMSSSPRMYGSHGAGSPNPGGLSYMGNLGNPSLNSMTNAINQITTNSVSSVPSKPTSPAGSGANSSLLHGQAANGPSASGDNSNNITSSHGGVGGDSSSMMSPMSGSDTQESSSRPSSTTTPGQTADAANSTSDTVGSDGSGSMPSDSTSVDSGFHSALDHSEKPPSDPTPTQSCSPSSLNQLPSANGVCDDKSSHEIDDTKMPCSDADAVSTYSSNNLHTASAMTSVAAGHSGTTQSIPTPVSSETENTGSQTSSLPFSMMSVSNSSTSNGPHYPHHPHHGMGYMVPHEGPMSSAHMMQGPGMHHPSMGNMPYNMPHSMSNSMPHGSGMPGMMSSMPPNMPPGSMPGTMPPGSMSANMPGSMPSNMPPCSMPPGSMHNSMPTGNNSMGSGSMPQNNCVPVPSLPDEPPEKKKKKSSTDLSKLYDMGNEVDRRPFLDKLLSFLEEKGTPITSMPSISKQPLDLYRLYFYVREKGGMVEVNKGKKWKEICTFVNIGSSASAAFTLKKNYIRYLFAFECRHDRGNVDPAPILADMEAQLEKKREQKKRVPSPGSQGSQDAFQPPSTPNSQMMEQYAPGMPPPYMQGPESSMGPMGTHVPPQMMMSNNMMGHPGSMMGGQPNMPPHPSAMGGGPGPGPGGMMGPNGMMMSGPPSVGPGQGMPPSAMMGGNIGPQGGMISSSTSMMGPGGPAGMIGPGMHGHNIMGPNSFVSNSMMHGCNSMGPSSGGMGPNSSSMGPNNGGMGPNNGGMGPNNGPCLPMMTPASSGSSTVVCGNTTSSSSGGSIGPHSNTSVPLPPSSTPNSRPATADSVSIQDPFADDLNSSPGPTQFPQRPGGNGPNSGPAFSSSQPPVSTSATSMANFCSRPAASPSSSTMPYSGVAPSGDRQGNEPVQSSFRRPVDSFPPASAPSFPGRSESAQFPFGQQYERERFDPSSASHPGPQFRQSQPGMMMSSGGSEPAYAGRFPGQQPAPFRPPVPGEQYGGSQTFSGHGPGFGPRTPVPQDQYSSYSPQPQAPPPQQQSAYPGVRPSPPVGREMSGSPYVGGPAGGSVSQYPDWNSTGTGHMTYSSHLDGHSDSYMSDMRSGREGGPWSPMQQRYSQTSGSSYMPPAPSTPPMGGSYGRPHPQRASPQVRDKLPTAQKLQQKAGSVMPTPQFPPKKDVVFPPDSVEAVQPQLAKRRRLTHKDIGPVEAWRLMMSLKSGLLAESTWALDTLNVLLFDDSTVAYFNLSHLPGLLEVLTEHFRASLIHIFPIFHDLELRSKGDVAHECLRSASVTATAPEKNPDACEDSLLPDLLSKPCDFCLDKASCPNYSLVTRQGKLVKLEEKPVDCSVLETKSWDVFCNFSSGFRLWQKGHGDTTQHIASCLESHYTHELLSDLCFKLRTKKCAGAKSRWNEDSEIKAACSAERSVGIGKCVQVKSEKSVKDLKQETDASKQSKEQISLKQGKDNHSDICDQEVHRNNFIKKLERKSEPRDPELHRCESNDSLPPPELPAATQDKPNTEHCSTLDDCSGNALKEEVDEKPAPDLVCEGARDSCPEKEPPTALVTAENEGSKEGQAERQEQLCVEDDGTGEAVVAMIKEHESELEEEAYHRDDAPLCVTQADQEEAGRRCVAISNIFRSLSCIPGNEVLLSGHHGLMLLLGRLLMLHHCHPSRPKSRPAAPLPQESEDGEAEAEPVEMVEEETELVEAEQDYATSAEWWWDTLDALRENTLVILANICSHMQMRDMDQEVCMPLLDGLLHWMVCPSSCACDPLPSAPNTSLLSPQRLVLEALCKLCIHDDNVDLLLATPPFSRILLLVSRLVRLLSDRSQPVPREFSVVLLSRLVQGDTIAARTIALQHPAISLLIEFLEAAEQSAMAVASQQGFSVLQSNPEMMGTSLDMLRRASATLLCLAHVPENRKLFLHHQNRLLTLVMSQILDPSVTQIISDVLFECSQPVPPQS